MKAITHYFAYKHLKLILKEDCSIAEKKRMLRLLLRVYVPEQILANKNTPYYKCQCGRFYNGKKCNECGYSGPPPGGLKPIEKKEPEHSQEIRISKEEHYARALEEYKSSNDHYTADRVIMDMNVSIEEALEKGFEENFCGIKCYFTNILKTKIEVKHPLEGKRKNIIYLALIKQPTFKNIQPHRDQTILYQTRQEIMNGKRIYIIIDSKTGIVNSVLKADASYVRRHFGINT